MGAGGQAAGLAACMGGTERHIDGRGTVRFRCGCGRAKDKGRGGFGRVCRCPGILAGAQLASIELECPCM